MQDRHEFELAISYTQEKTASEGDECGKCCVALQQGARLKWVANKEAGLAGRFICLACWDRALQKPTTVVRQTAQVVSRPLYAPDTASISKAVSASQRGTIMPGNRVVAMSGMPMISTQIPALNFQPANNIAPGVAALQNQAPLGYTRNHQDYAEHKKRWALAARSGLPPIPQAGVNRVLGPAAHTLPPIPFMALVVVKDMKKKDIAITNSEGHHINFNALPGVIVETVIQVLKKPVLDYCKGYEPEWERMVVREKSTMVDLSCTDLVPPDHPYLCNRELEFFKEKKGRLSNELTKARLTFLLEISPEEVAKIEAFWDSLECDVAFDLHKGKEKEKGNMFERYTNKRFSHLETSRPKRIHSEVEHTTSPRAPKRFHAVSSTAGHGTQDSPLDLATSTDSLPSVSRMLYSKPRQPLGDLSQDKGLEGKRPPIPPLADLSQRSQPAMASLAGQPPTVPATTTPAATTPATARPTGQPPSTVPATTTPAATTPVATTPAATTPAKTVPEIFTPAVTTPATTTPVPGPLRVTAPAKPNLHPSAQQVAVMAKSFTSGGTHKPDYQKVIALHLVHIHTWSLSDITWSDLISKPSSTIDNSINNAQSSLLHYDVRHFLARGGMKCAFKAFITENTLFCDPHTSKALIILKQPYDLTRHEKIKYLKAADEYALLYKEATQLVWANSLLQLAYSLVDSCLHEAKDPPPFDIPCLRFIKAALASDSTPIKDIPSDKGSRFFLLEEFIDPETHGEFVKYIHNQSLSPNRHLSDENMETALFLCFTQHIQYTVTGHLAFVSDYQGAGNLLTDPQIMTNPELDGDLFGDGNIGIMLYEFPLKHECNHFCRWFKLPSVNPQQPEVQTGSLTEQGDDSLAE